MPGGTDQMTASLAERQAESVESVSATGATEVVAGIEGDLYEITWIDMTGERHTDTMVLSDDPLVLEFNDVFSDLAGTGETDDPRSAAIVAEGKGLLRFGEMFRVVEINGDTPPSGAFELPADPVDFGDMLQGIQQHR